MADCRTIGDCTPALLVHLKSTELFKALCDANRLTLLGRLASSGEPLTVTEASECCGIHLSGVSRHLAILKQAGIVEAEKRGREVVYSVAFGPMISVLRGLADALEACRAADDSADSDSDSDIRRGASA